jgi:hypothetical protein
LRQGKGVREEGSGRCVTRERGREGKVREKGERKGEEGEAREEGRGGRSERGRERRERVTMTTTMGRYTLTCRVLSRTVPCFTANGRLAIAFA